MVHAGEGVHGCVHMQKPEEDIRSLPPLLLTFYLKQDLPDSEAHCFC